MDRRVNLAIEPHKARRLYLLLRDEISSGAHAPGARLASEPALAAEHGVSRVTVRRALDLLAAEGLVLRRPGAGTFVRHGASARPVIADLPNMLSALIAMGRASKVRLLSFDYLRPPPDIAAALELDAEERVQRSVRVRMIDDAPFSYLITHVPERIGTTYSEADLATTPFLELVERSGIAAPERAVQTISATLAGPEMAEALGLGVGAALTTMTRTVYDRDGRGVEHLQAFYRPDRYVFQFDLLRTGNAGARRWTPAVVVPMPAPPAAAKRKPRA